MPHGRFEKIPPGSFKKLLLSDAEITERLKDVYVFDDHGEIVGEKLSPRQQALLSGVDWYDHSNLPDPDDAITTDLPDWVTEDPYEHGR